MDVICKNTPRACYHINGSAVQRVATDVLGLVGNIHISCGRRDQRSLGCYHGYGFWVPGGGGNRKPLADQHHFIEINPRINFERINLTLIHEMVHALQCERDYNYNYRAFFRDYNNDLRELRARSVTSRRTTEGHARYRSQRHEVEAVERSFDIALCHFCVAPR